MSWLSEAVDWVSGGSERKNAKPYMDQALGVWEGVQGPVSDSQSWNNSIGRSENKSTSSQGSSQSSAGSSSQQASSKSNSEQFATFGDTVATALSKLGGQEYERYSNMFGSIEDNLMDYYNNLNPDTFAGQANQNAQMQYDQTMSQLKDNLAARGMFDSGIGSQATLGMGIQLAQQKAQNQFNAPHQVAQMQGDWLGQGYNRMDAAMQGMATEGVVTVGGGGISSSESQSSGSSSNSSSGSSYGSSNSYGFSNQDSSGGSWSHATDDSAAARGKSDILMGKASNAIGAGQDRGNLFGGLLGMGASFIGMG